MTIDLFQQVITGSLGAVAFLCISLWLLLTGRVHPDKAYQSQVERVRLLEGENSRLNGSVVVLTKMNTQLQVDVATLKQEIIHLRGRLDKLLEER